jgi:hypothetical protein
MRSVVAESALFRHQLLILKRGRKHAAQLARHRSHCRRLVHPLHQPTILRSAVVAMKRHNPGGGCPRIARQIAFAFGVEIDKDVVRRILSSRYRLESDSDGPFWLTFLGRAKDVDGVAICSDASLATTGLAQSPHRYSDFSANLRFVVSGWRLFSEGDP